MKTVQYVKTTLAIAALSSVCASANAGSISQLSNQVAPEFAQSEQTAVASKGQDLIQLSTTYVNDQGLDGSWADIDYSIISTTGSEFREHLARIRILAADYHLNSNAAAATAANKAIRFWYSSARSNSNWWWNEIGKQLFLGPSAIMLGATLDADLKQNIVSDMPSAPYKTGANRTDISKGVIFGGLLGNDEVRLQSGLSGIEETIVVTEDEGIQADFSFQQHGPQLYTGGYGEVFFDTASFWAYHVKDTPWRFALEREALLGSYLIDGVRWMQSHGTLDYNAMGRGISRDATLDNAPLIKQTQYIEALAPQRAQETQALNLHLNGGPSGLQGFKSFWRSDYASKVGSGHFVGIKMNSVRIEPTEAGNGENLLGNWLGFGSTFIMQRGDEYHNLFPVWDWKLIPGVTAPHFAQKPKDWGQIEMQTTFVGSASNGRHGVAVMDMDVWSTQAKKAWFSFDDELVALGAGIRSTRSEYVSTTVNQTRLNGDVTVDGQVFSQGSRAIVNANWVHHDGVGYVFPNYWYGHMDNRQNTGSWKAINSGGSDAQISDGVFMLRMGHSWQPTSASYAYQIVPEKTATETATYAQSNPVQILTNTDKVQAVYHTELNSTGIVFYQAGSLTLANGAVVTVDKPSVLVVDSSQVQPQITLSTPGYGTQVKVTYSGGGLDLVTSVVTSSLKAELGKSHSVDFSNPVIEPQPATIMVGADAFVRDGSYANQSFGQNSFLVVKKDGAGYNRKVVLSFDLSGQALTATTKAVLKLHVKNVNTSAQRQVQFSRLASANWTESNISWNSLPAVQMVGSKMTITPQDKGSWIEVDVTDLVTEGVNSFLIENPGVADGKGDVSFSSRESGLAPELVITP